MKTLKIMVLAMTLVFSVGLKAQTDIQYYEPELLMVSQPTMQYYSNMDTDFLRLYFDVQNIGSDTYKGDFMILLEPDTEYYYAVKRIKVKAGSIKRIKIDIDLRNVYYDNYYTVMPIYEYMGEWYPLTMYEDFEPLVICVNNPPSVTYIVKSAPPVPTYYHIDVRLHRPPYYGYYNTYGYVTAGYARPYGVIIQGGPQYQSNVRPHNNTVTRPSSSSGGVHVNNTLPSSAGSQIRNRRPATSANNVSSARPSVNSRSERKTTTSSSRPTTSSNTSSATTTNRSTTTTTTINSGTRTNTTNRSSVNTTNRPTTNTTNRATTINSGTNNNSTPRVNNNTNNSSSNNTRNNRSSSVKVKKNTTNTSTSSSSGRRK